MDHDICGRNVRSVCITSRILIGTVLPALWASGLTEQHPEAEDNSVTVSGDV